MHELCMSSLTSIYNLPSSIRLSAGVSSGRSCIPAPSAALAAIFYLIPARFPLLSPVKGPHTGQLIVWGIAQQQFSPDCWAAERWSLSGKVPGEWPIADNADIAWQI